MHSILDAQYGPRSHDLRAFTSEPDHNGARAALETFYYAFNHGDIDALEFVWLADIFAQLNNPLGGILRGGKEIVELYERVFSSKASVEVTFQDIIEYATDTFAVFAGREIGAYVSADGHAHALRIRTTRIFEFSSEHQRWLQVHHHGSLDDPVALSAYQQAMGRV